MNHLITDLDLDITYLRFHVRIAKFKATQFVISSKYVPPALQVTRRISTDLIVGNYFPTFRFMFKIN